MGIIWAVFVHSFVNNELLTFVPKKLHLLMARIFTEVFILYMSICC
jgi:hypothetical protein